MVAISFMAMCGLLALFDFVNLCDFTRRFLIYWRHPDRELFFAGSVAVQMGNMLPICSGQFSSVLGAFALPKGYLDFSSGPLHGGGVCTCRFECQRSG